MEREFILTDKIISRAEELGVSAKKDRITHMMDIERANEYFDIDLERWLNANNDTDFVHDYLGIYHHINRTKKVCELTSKDWDCFCPRFCKYSIEKGA